MGLLSALLAGCLPSSRRIDTDDAAARLTSAVRAVPGVSGGEILVEDNRQTGRTIRGRLLVDATDADGVAEIFRDGARALVGAWDELEVEHSFTVRVEALADPDRSIALNTPQLLGRDRLDTVTIDELRAEL
ncbi:hypothetical protein ACT3TZ_06985 [Brachybacterium sp. AOP25-B2-12]|uniref:hypothetical protein n=1 Tax=Brachybacterium sp. AOP25-B2-12 TaxID=3457710 RepID=UPI0040332053